MAAERSDVQYSLLGLFPLLFSRLFNLHHFYDTIFICCWFFLRIINVVGQLAIASNQPLNMSHLSLNTFRRLWCARSERKFFSKFMFSNILTWIYVLAPGIRCASFYLCCVRLHKKLFLLLLVPPSPLHPTQEDNCKTHLHTRDETKSFWNVYEEVEREMFIEWRVFFSFVRSWRANRLNATQTQQTVVGVLWG